MGSDIYDALVEREIDEEILFEEFLAEKEKRLHQKLLAGRSLRRDVRELLELKANEPQFRKLVADLMRLMREEAHNGYSCLPRREQERILDCRLEFIGRLFGNFDIFYSRIRLMNCAHENQTPLPLRKDVTIKAIRAYKPKSLLEEPVDYNQPEQLPI